jgi:alkylhydroperoxidase family enzyme
MPRLREVPRSEVTDEAVLDAYQLLFDDRDPVAEPGTATGTRGDWWTVFALVPDVMRHAIGGFQLYQSPDRHLPPHWRELGQTRTGWLVGSQFVFSQHCKASRAAGVSDEKVGAIPSWSVSDVFDETERAILAYTDCLVEGFGRVPDDVFAALKKSLSDEQILELTYITCMYIQHAVIVKALRLEFDDRDEPVVEIAAPEGYTAGEGLRIAR